MRIFGQKHFTHPARSDFGDNAVMRKCCVDAQRLIHSLFTTYLFRPSYKRHSYLKLFIKITSRSSVPRESASCFPSRDQSKAKMMSVLKSVNCVGCPPSTC